MKDKKRIERDITASKTCIQTYLKCIKADETCITNHQADIFKAEKELAELEKPELRHGDYKVSKTGFVQFFVKESKTGQIRLCQEEDVLRGGKEDYCIFDDEGLRDKGNFIADLKALSEPLEEFGIDNGCGQFFHAEYNINGIWLNIKTSSAAYDIKEVEEIILNLRRLVATAKQKGE